MNNINSKKKIFLTTISISILIIVLVGITYAFFNYTRTGTRNLIKVGRISFESKNEETITLNNLFPIDPESSSEINDSTKVGTYSIDIKGDTDYVDGIEYLVSIIDANIYTTEGQIVPISLDFTISNGLGTSNDNYFTARESKNATIYKKLVGDTLVGDEMLLVGYIKPNTTSGQALGVDGNITIKAYLDKNKILISDTYDGTESDNMGTSNSLAEGKTVITTNEWNALQQNGVSFKVKVEANEGIWVNGSLNDVMKKSAVLDNINSTYVNNTTPGIDFREPSSDTNGKGIYMMSSTQNESYPIMYYRGDIDNNNVLFGNKCWKAIRTTDTGGVKLLYNGEYGHIYERIPLEENEYTIIKDDGNKVTYDNVNKYLTLSLSEEEYEINFSIAAGDYVIELTGEYGSNSYFYHELYAENESESIFSENLTGSINARVYYHLASSETIIYYMYQEDVVTPTTLNIRVYKLGQSLGIGCENDKTVPGIIINDNSYISFSAANSSNETIGYVGKRIDAIFDNTSTSGKVFGTSFTYENGVYTLVNTRVGLNSSHHYTCFSSNASDTCSSIRYYSYSGYYVALTNGDSIESKMMSFLENVDDSNAKTIIEDWYESNLQNYTNKLEDTIYCNDRTIYSWGSFDNQNGSVNDYEDGLFFSGYYRYITGTPSLSCSSKKDSFTVNNKDGNKLLSYPIALITNDELMLAGGSAGREVTSFINSTGRNFTMTPYSISSRVYGFLFTWHQQLDYSLSKAINHIRPVVTLKYGMNILKGDGTEFNPYVIE